MSPHLSFLLNLRIMTGKFPTRFKFARINPFFQKGSDTDVKNHRSISIYKSLVHVRVKFFRESSRAFLRTNLDFETKTNLLLYAYSSIFMPISIQYAEKLYSENFIGSGTPNFLNLFLNAVESGGFCSPMCGALVPQFLFLYISS